MVPHLGRLLTAVAGAAVLAGCGGGATVAQSPSATPVGIQTTTEPRNDKATVHEMAGLTGFVSPSGNVSCMLDANWARCDIIDRDWSAPPRPADCELDYGQGLSLTPGEQAQFVCAGDTAFGPDAVLPYGDSISAGVLRCESAEAGITCRDTTTGHGFSIAREAYRLF